MSEGASLQPGQQQGHCHLQLRDARLRTCRICRAQQHNGLNLVHFGTQLVRCSASAETTRSITMSFSACTTLWCTCALVSWTCRSAFVAINLRTSSKVLFCNSASEQLGMCNLSGFDDDGHVFGQICETGEDVLMEHEKFGGLDLQHVLSS